MKTFNRCLVAAVILLAVSNLHLYRQCLYFARESQSIMEEYAAFVREQEAFHEKQKAYDAAMQVEIERLQRMAVKALAK